MAKRRPGRKPKPAKKPRRPSVTPTLPVVPDQKVLEARSGAIFVETVSPWPVTPWTHHDYGMDAMMEILRRRDDGGDGHLNTGRRIGVQLKASEDAPSGSHASVEVRVATLRYWMGSHEPFAVVFCHVPTRRICYRWVDDDLVAELTAREPSWFMRQTVTIRVPRNQVLSADRLDDVDRESRQVVVRRHRVLAPGTYDRLLTEARAAMEDIAAAAKTAGLQSVVSQLDGAAKSVRNATYVVALAGRMRAGKSTLFNALARREISPVARRPTTAVPVLATAGDADAATVLFLDGRKLAISATSDALAEYATQDGNPDNRKGVRIVTVRLVSERLERGIAILDAPGLFDPSKAIRDATASAIASAHAVLFVMDVSAARTGGFAVESHVLDELKGALDRSERVFLLLNKADELKKRDREDVLATLDHALGREKLAERLAGPPMFISAQRAWDWVVTRGAESPIAELEAQVWDYLLETNSTGVERLETAVRASLRAVGDSLGLIALRRATSDQARTIEGRLASAAAEIAAVRAACRSAKERALAAVETLLRNELGALPRKIGDELRAAGTVPSKAATAERVDNVVETILNEIWEISLRALECDAGEVSEQLQAALDQVGLEHEPPGTPTIVGPSLTLPDVSWVAPEALGFGVVGTFLALAFGPAYVIAAGFGSFLLGAILGKERQLAREIAKLERRVQSEITKAFANLARDISRPVALGYDRLERYVADRWAVFEKDASDKLSRAGTPLTAPETAAIEQLQAALEGTCARLESVAEQIRWTPDPR
jgi:hypothetical protein